MCTVASTTRKRIGVEHHRDVLGAGQMREQIGVPFPRQARQPERFLVDGRGRDGVDGAALRVGDRPDDGVVGGATRRRRSGRLAQMPRPGGA